ncbi:hypothetical protein AC1031_007804 [Aphanomyces cochlioides]|nr:hypothetical protein AC1031_007804 [Aphanomyces cochlioides]
MAKSDCERISGRDGTSVWNLQVDDCSMRVLLVVALAVFGLVAGSTPSEGHRGIVVSDGRQLSGSDGSVESHSAETPRMQSSRRKPRRGKSMKKRHGKSRKAHGSKKKAKKQMFSMVRGTAKAVFNGGKKFAEEYTKKWLKTE